MKYYLSTMLLHWLITSERLPNNVVAILRISLLSPFCLLSERFILIDSVFVKVKWQNSNTEECPECRNFTFSLFHSSDSIFMVCCLINVKTVNVTKMRLQIRTSLVGLLFMFLKLSFSLNNVILYLSAIHTCFILVPRSKELVSFINWSTVQRKM